MAKRKEEEYEEPDSEEYDEDDEDNELPDVDDDEEDDDMTKDEQEAMRNLAKVKANGSEKAYRKLRVKTCRRFPSLGLCQTEHYEWPFLPKDV